MGVPARSGAAYGCSCTAGLTPSWGERAAECLYCDDVMGSLAAIFDIGVHVCGCDGQEVADAFIVSGLAHEFERPNPVFVAGKSGIELCEFLLSYVGSDYKFDGSCNRFVPTPDYWLGWVLGYFQMATCVPYKRVFKALSYRELVGMYYPLHEAHEDKFVDALLDELYPMTAASQLKARREEAGFSQAELSRRSGAGLRSIQMYEQGNRDLSKARAADVLRIADVLGCTVADLVEA